MGSGLALMWVRRIVEQLSDRIREVELLMLERENMAERRRLYLAAGESSKRRRWSRNAG